MFDITNDMHLLNLFNTQNQRPLHVACKNGHLEIVKLLLNNGANPHLNSYVDENEHENLLEVSARWSHKNILLFLLETV